MMMAYNTNMILDMNYIGVIYCILACLIALDWFSRGRSQYQHKFYEGSRGDSASEEALVRSSRQCCCVTHSTNSPKLYNESS